MATVAMRLGEGKCQHVTLTVTIDGKSKEYVTTRDELAAGVAEKDAHDVVFHNVKTNIKLDAETDWSKLKTSIEGRTFKT